MKIDRTKTENLKGGKAKKGPSLQPLRTFSDFLVDSFFLFNFHEAPKTTKKAKLMYLHTKRAKTKNPNPCTQKLEDCLKPTSLHTRNMLKTHAPANKNEKKIKIHVLYEQERAKKLKSYVPAHKKQQK